MKRFISYYKPHMRLFVIDMLCALLMAGGDLLFPVITRNVIDDYIPQGNMRLIVYWCGIMLAVYILRAALAYVVQYYGHLVGVGMQADMRRDLFSHLQRMPFSYFDENKTGSIMSRIVNDLMEISELAHHGPEDLFISIIMLAGSFAIMCSQNIPLTLIIFAFLPFMLLFALKKRGKMNAAFARRREEVSEINATIENSISGIRVAKAFENSGSELTKFAAANDRFQSSCRRAYRVMAEFHTGMDLLSNLIMVVVLLAGGLFATAGRITPGQFASYIVFVSLFFSPIKRLVQFVEQYQTGMTGFERFTQILDMPVEEDEPGAVKMHNVKGDIEFQNVSFTYEDDKSQVLHSLDFSVKSGSTVALVGPSGSGKSTICHLIPRFYEISSGAILLDGRDIRTIQRASLHEAVGIVQQDVFLFTGTIRDNIGYGKPDASQQEIEAAARNANIHEYICSLPDGYDTYVGEHGLKLSGGQKQRIAIARVFLKNPPVLILDEATSALDNATERLILQSLDRLCQGRTTIVVAHRLSTVKRADRIVVLTDEGIKEQGTHEELLAARGVYERLHRSGMSKREEETA